MGNKITGGCKCAAVRYEIEGEPLFCSNCHCRDCQRSTGSAYTPIAGFPKDAVRVTGAVKYFRRNGDSGAAVSEAFCPECGANLFGRADALEGLCLVNAGSLDDPTLFRPQMNIFTASAQPWDYMDPDLPKYPKMPPMGG
jgi:hypothetical protein